MRLSTIILAAALPAAAMAQSQQQGQQAQQAQPQQAQAQQTQQTDDQQGQQQQQQGCNQQSGANQQGQQKRSSLGHDVGNAAATGGSQVAGAAVAGPIGAAVAPVLVNHVGHAVKRAIKGKKKGGQQAQAQTGCAPARQ
jgi:hypothetical protein